MSRIIIVTDIHGMYEQFTQLLSLCQLDYGRDIFICNGDVISRGTVEDQIKCIDLLFDIEEKMKDRFHWIEGNHERDMIEWYNYDLVQNSFFRRVTRKLRDEYRDDEMPESDKRVIRKIYRRQFEKQVDFPQFTVTHSHAESEVDINNRLLIVGHRYVEVPTYIDSNGKKFPLKNGELPKSGIIFFDTGGVYGNKLTALIIEDGILRYVQV